MDQSSCANANANANVNGLAVYLRVPHGARVQRETNRTVEGAAQGQTQPCNVEESASYKRVDWFQYTHNQSKSQGGAGRAGGIVSKRSIQSKRMLRSKKSLSSLPLTPESDHDSNLKRPGRAATTPKAKAKSTAGPGAGAGKAKATPCSTTLDWKWAIGHLCSSHNRTKNTSRHKARASHRCFVNLTDTLFVVDDPDEDDEVDDDEEEDEIDDEEYQQEQEAARCSRVSHWLFTDANGVVSSHKHSQITRENVDKCFFGGARASDCNSSTTTNRKVAIVNYANGLRRVVNDKDLSELLEEVFSKPKPTQMQRSALSSSSSSSRVVGIQKYVTCQDDGSSTPHFLLGEYTVDPDDTQDQDREQRSQQQEAQAGNEPAHDTPGKTRVTRMDGDFFNVDHQQQLQEEEARTQVGQGQLVSLRLHREVETALHEMIRNYQHRWSADYQQQVRVVAIKAEFVVDPNHRLWLVHVPFVTLQLANTASSDGSSVMATSIQSSITMNNNHAGAKHKCRGDFCNVVPLTLRGLYADLIHELEALEEEEDAPTEADGSERSIGVKRDRKMLLEDEKGRVDQVLEDVLSNRARIGFNNILLAREEMKLITGSFQQQVEHAQRARVGGGVQDDDEAFRAFIASQWQELDTMKRSELGRTNPQHFYKQVEVCANCHRIYSKLASHRATAFTSKRSVRQLGEQVDQSHDDRVAPDEPSGDTKQSNIEGQHSNAIEQMDNEYDKLFLMELAKQSQQIDAETSALEVPRSSSISASESSSRSERGEEPVRELEESESIPVIVTNPRNKKQFDKVHGGKLALPAPLSLCSPKSLSEMEYFHQLRPLSVNNDTMASTMPTLPPTIMPLNANFTSKMQQGSSSLSKKDKKYRNTKRLVPINTTGPNSATGFQLQQQQAFGAGKSNQSKNSSVDASILLKSFENKIVVLETQLKASQLELGKTRHNYEQQLATATEKLESLQREHHAVIKAKDDEIKSLRQHHDQEVARLQRQHGQQQGSGEDPTKALAPTPAPSASEMTNLIETIDSLNAQLNQMVSNQEALKRQWEDAKQKEVSRIQATFQNEIDSYRLKIHQQTIELEDKKTKITNLENQHLITSTQILQLKNTIDQLSADISQPGGNNGAGGELNANSGSGGSGASVNKQGGSRSVSFVDPTKPEAGTVNAKDFEALEKHLNNKIEYLKAQVASEMRCKEELGANLSSLTLVIENMKKDKKKALNEMEEANKRILEKLQERHNQENEITASNMSALQAKIVALQANLSDLVQENVLSRNREEHAKLSMEKLAQENAGLNRQIVELESTIEEMQEKYVGVKNTLDEAQRVNLEATLRRLDNERIYLKNQLDTELAQKQQLMKDNIKMTDELQIQQQSLNQQITLMRNEIAQKDKEICASGQVMQQKTVLWQMESQNFKIQVADLQQKSVKLQEQKLLLTNEVEFTKQEASKMQQNLLSLQQELVDNKKYLQSFQERNSKALQTLKNSLSQLEKEKNDQLSALQSQLLAQQQQQEKTAQDHRLQIQQFTNQLQQTKKICACVQIFAWVRHKWQSQSKQHGLHKWQLNCRLKRLASDLSTQKHQELTLLHQQLEQANAEQMAQITAKFTAERTQILEQMEHQWTDEKHHMQQSFQNQLKQLEVQFASAKTAEIQNLHQQFHKQKQDMQQIGSQTIEALEKQWQQALQDKQQELEAKEEAFCTKEKLLAEEFQQVLAERLGELQKQFDHERQSLLEGFQDQLEAKQREIAGHKRSIEEHCAQGWEMRLEELEQQRQQQKKQHESTIDMLQQDHASQMVETVQQVVDTLKAKHCLDISELNDHWQQQLQSERDANQRALQEALARMESQNQQKMESLINELKDKKNQSILQNTLKWQKALEEINERKEIEKQISYQNGVADREKEWQKAALQIKQKQQEEIDSVQQEALKAIQACEQKHELALSHEVDKIRQELETVKQMEMQQMEQQWLAKMNDFKLNQEESFNCQQQQRESQLANVFELTKNQLTDAHQQELTEQKQRLDTLLQQELTRQRELLESEFASQRQEFEQQLQNQWMQQFEALQKTHQEELTDTVNKLTNQLQTQFAQDQESATRQLEQEFATQLQQQEQASAKEQEDAIAQVQEESEKLIEQVEQAMSQLKKQKEKIEQELDNVRVTLEQAEDQTYDLTQVNALLNKRLWFHKVLFCVEVRHIKEHLQTNHQQQLKQMQLENSKQLDLWTSKLNHMTCQHEMLQKHQLANQQSHEVMYETLVNYKHDELIRLRSASAVIANELQIIDGQQDEMTSMLQTLQKELKQMEMQGKLLEEESKQCALQSSSVLLEDGQVNASLAAKKRRLHEEFESILAQMDAQRVKIRNVGSKQSELQQKRQQKDNEMKLLERQLVQILVEQQKKLLQLVTSVREASAMLQAAASSASTTPATTAVSAGS